MGCSQPNHHVMCNSNLGNLRNNVPKYKYLPVCISSFVGTFPTTYILYGLLQYHRSCDGLRHPWALGTRHLCVPLGISIPSIQVNSYLIMKLWSYIYIYSFNMSLMYMNKALHTHSTTKSYHSSLVSNANIYNAFQT